jgi:hypothetical protein
MNRAEAPAEYEILAIRSLLDDQRLRVSLGLDDVPGELSPPAPRRAPAPMVRRLPVSASWPQPQPRPRPERRFDRRALLDSD